MEIGEIIEVEGEKRAIIAFTMVSGYEVPVTRLVNGDGHSTVVESIDKTTEEKDEIKKDEVAGETTEIKQASISYICEHCGRELATKTAYKMHTKACTKNPESHKYEA